MHTYENTGNLSGRFAGRAFASGATHRRTSSNVSASSVTGVAAGASNVNPTFRLEDELDTVQPAGRVVFDLEPRALAGAATPVSATYRMARQNSLEMERPGTLVRRRTSHKQTCVLL